MSENCVITDLHCVYKEFIVQLSYLVVEKKLIESSFYTIMSPTTKLFMVGEGHCSFDKEVVDFSPALIQNSLLIKCSKEKFRYNTDLLYILPEFTKF